MSDVRDRDTEAMAAAPAEPVRRAHEIEDVTNLYFIHPIANFFAVRLVRLGVHPNAVSIAGMGFGLLAGIAYYHYQSIAWVIAGFVLMIAWHVADGADGQLARLTRKQSPSGRILDGICDYVTFFAVYIGIGLTASRMSGAWVWAVLVIAGICHAAQSAIYEAQRHEYGFWVHRRQPLPPLDRPHRHQRGGIAGRIHQIYEAAQIVVLGNIMACHRRLALIMHRRPQDAPVIRGLYRDNFSAIVRRWSLLSANYRTLGIFLCALFGAPMYFFAFEIIGFSLLTVMLLAGQPARYRVFFARLHAAMN